jgi:ankyrin repeat protein
MTAVRRAVTVVAVLLSLAGRVLAQSEPAVADAAEHADWAAVRTLVSQRADVRAAQVDGMTALHWAAQHDNREAAALLLGAGASASAANRYGITPLSLACTNGNAAMIELLLTAGADPNTTLPGGETALMTAARTGRLEAVRALLAAGAAVNAKEERRGQTALGWAAAEGHADVVRALLAAGGDVTARLPSGLTPFLLAVRQGHMDVVGAFLAAGVDVNEGVPVGGRRQGYGGGPPPAGMSPLLLAVRNGHFELAAALLDAGADPNGGAAGYTVLHAITVVRKPGVGDNDPAPAGSGALSSLDFVRKLVARGADVNARMTRRPNLNNTRLNELGATPFMLASLTADVDLMRLLVSLGADPSIPNVENSTPLIVAAGLATRSPGEDAGTEEEVIAAIELLLGLGADINAVDANGETAMHAAAYKNLPKVVRLLAARGAKIEVWNQPDRWEWTPLAIAVGYRFGNFKPHAETEAAIRAVMLAAGVTPPKEVVAVTQQIY